MCGVDRHPDVQSKYKHAIYYNQGRDHEYDSRQSQKKPVYANDSYCDCFASFIPATAIIAPAPNDNNAIDIILHPDIELDVSILDAAMVAPSTTGVLNNND
jgi:hypothetical protein